MASARKYPFSQTTLKYNIVVMGDQYCGKSSLIERYCSGSYDPNYVQTIGSDLCKKDLLLNDVPINLLICDTAGQENMKTIIKSIYRKAHGILLVFDFARVGTFQHINDWIDLIKMNCDTTPEMVLVGNKADLAETHRRVTAKEAQLMAVHRDLIFFEASALTNLNVTEAFQQLTLQVYNNWKRLAPSDLNTSIRLHHSETEKKDKCCK